jgi:hypothetical protein
LYCLRKTVLKQGSIRWPPLRQTSLAYYFISGHSLTERAGKKHKEAAAAFVSGGGDAVGLARHRRIFVLQHIISSLAKHLKPVIDATKNFTQKKLTLTYEELQQVPFLLLCY